MLGRNSLICALKSGSGCGSPPNTSQDLLKRLLDRRWSLSCPDAQINEIMVLNDPSSSFENISRPCLGVGGEGGKTPSFYVVRDDILHPLVNGNKARKLDALLPLLEDNAITDVVTCGGCQSAHTAAVAVSCAERGIKSHLLLRGEEPQTLTGYNLISKLFGNVVYVPRSIYAKRDEMLANHAQSILGPNGNGSIICLNDIIMQLYSKNPVTLSQKSKKLVIINEGAGDAVALLGVMRLIKYLSEDDLFGKKEGLKMVVDAGTGTTAVGLALGALCLGLPWEVCAVMLADKIDAYKQKEQDLITQFSSAVGLNLCLCEGNNDGIVQWIERTSPRRFGKVLKGEVEECQKIAQQTGILVDPIYTLAAWDIAAKMSRKEDTKVVMLHTGGTLGMFGIAQRYNSYFHDL